MTKSTRTKQSIPLFITQNDQRLTINLLNSKKQDNSTSSSSSNNKNVPKIKMHLKKSKTNDDPLTINDDSIQYIDIDEENDAEPQPHNSPKQKDDYSINNNNNNNSLDNFKKKNKLTNFIRTCSLRDKPSPTHQSLSIQSNKKVKIVDKIKKNRSNSMLNLCCGRGRGRANNRSNSSTSPSQTRSNKKQKDKSTIRSKTIDKNENLLSIIKDNLNDKNPFDFYMFPLVVMGEIKLDILNDTSRAVKAARENKTINVSLNFFNYYSTKFKMK
jgi:hypothetical protein